MSEEERREFLVWYESQKYLPFDNRHVLEIYSQDDVTVVRQACRVFRRELMHIGNIDVFDEAIPIASACNNILRKRFLKSEAIGLIPAGGYMVITSTGRRQCSGCCIWNRRTGCGSCMLVTGTRTGCQNYTASVWTVTVPRPIYCMNTLAAFSTGTRVRRSVPSAP